MSELAFNATGESLEFPPEVTDLRTLRMKVRGTPESACGRDGRPVTVPVPANIAALRMPRAQLLDIVVAKLQALQPEAAATPLIGTAITALRTLSLDQLLDVGVAKLQAAVASRSPPRPETTRVVRLQPAGRPRRAP